MNDLRPGRRFAFPSLAGRVAAIASVALAAPAFADDNAPETPTFARDVMPILQTRCLECHRPGDIAPMSFASYDETRPWAKSIREEVASRRMPPWHADPEGGPFLGDTSLSEKEIAVVTKWVDAGAPLGDPADMPPPVEFPSQWKSGEPDIVFQMPETFEIPAEGRDIYHCFVLDPMPEDAWVRGVEVLPDNRAVNHHVALFLDGTGRQAEALDARHEGPGYPCYGSPGFQPMDIFGVWAPGMTPDILPDGVARPIPKGARMVMQLHYHPNGQAETDRSSLGIHFAKGEVRRKVNLGIPMDFMLRIPAGAKDHVSTGSWTLPRDGDMLSVFPHMHTLGTDIRVTAYPPDGGERLLVSASRYDFNWQRNYSYVEPVRLPAGTRIEVRAVYDNSADNPNNPSNPPRNVGFGMGTNDEMNLAFVTFAYADEDRVAQGLPFPTESTIVMDASQFQGGTRAVRRVRREAGVESPGEATSIE